MKKMVMMMIRRLEARDRERRETRSEARGERLHSSTVKASAWVESGIWEPTLS
jgi:hypothetical protein